MNKSPKEKAKLFFNQYHNLIQDIGGDMGHEILVSILAKHCALIAVDEILRIRSVNKDDILSNYWEEVEQEINNL
jgi:hypothetical protein